MDAADNQLLLLQLLVLVLQLHVLVLQLNSWRQKATRTNQW